jgi:lipopolysaccharide export system permease protein
MIFQRAIRREMWNTVGAVFTTLFTIVITVVLIRILGDAAAGKVASADVAALIGFASLGYLPVIISLTGFIAVLLVVARSYQESEMVVWFASGLSLARWIRPVLQVGLPLVIITAMLSLWLTPWANQSAAEYRERFRNREDVSRIAPGKFQESAGGDKIFFVEGLTSDTTKVENVFVRQGGNRQDSVVVAEEGAITFDADGDKLLQLFKGRRYDGGPADRDFRVIEFQRYTIVVSERNRELADNKAARALPTYLLLSEPTKERYAELLWRVAIPIMCLIQMLLAIPLGFVNPRRGRALNLMVALLLAVTYSNAIGILQAQVGGGRLAMSSAWWPLHLAVLLLVVLLFVWRDNTNSRWHPARLWSLVRRALLVRHKEVA